MGNTTEEKVIDLTDTLGNMTATLGDIQKSLGALVVPVKGETDEKADLEDAGGMLAGAMNFDIMGVPLGKALIGGGIAILGTELIDGFFATSSVQTRGVIKLAGTGATMMFLRKPLGTAAAGAVALLLTFDALRDLTPLDAWMADLATKITGVATTAGLADKSNRRAAMVAPSTISDYYAQAEGRR